MTRKRVPPTEPMDELAEIVLWVARGYAETHPDVPREQITDALAFASRVWEIGGLPKKEQAKWLAQFPATRSRRR